jgi:hypothetical protein
LREFAGNVRCEDPRIDAVGALSAYSHLIIKLQVLRYRAKLLGLN